MWMNPLIERYFRLAPLADTDAYFAQFDTAATVEDEGREHHGVDAIRAWRSDVPRVTYAVRDVRSGEGMDVTCRDLRRLSRQPGAAGLSLHLHSGRADRVPGDQAVTVLPRWRRHYRLRMS